ncbi:MAG: xanthine dehydrogenase family protein subunit M [Chitinophagaceae bacterium]|nr:MAG: xanthine dehydrogenase family protein subunit M [Chitinophagaceae bacterium]
MNSFNYRRPQVIDEAINAHDQDAAYIGGGTNLIDLMKENVLKPHLLIDVNHLSGTNKIEELPDGSLRLGATVTNAVTAYHALVEKRFPLVSQAILAGASAQIRNMATNGGNLLQRTRCYYFYDTATPCNKRQPGSGCSAINGYNRIHAILGTSDHCIATHPSDFCVALAALEAVVEVKGPYGEREIEFEDFHRLPEDTPEVDNTLLSGELITGIRIPANRLANASHYLKVRDRESFAFALISVAAAFELKGDKIVTARIALGGVAHKPWRSKIAEEFLEGKTIAEDCFAKAANIILESAQDFGHNAFKIKLAQRSIVRACATATKIF